jgi:beta-1,4-mannosyl-glycoprotein beta-1,4-N-acetylglucosaminyltransferase
MSQFGADRWVLHLNSVPGFYLDVGCHDGIDISNTKMLDDNGWKGICIDPFPKNFETRTAQVVKACVYSSNDAEIEFDYSVEDPGCSGVHAELGVHKDRLYKTTTIQKHKIRTRTLENILEEYNAPSRIEYLNLDIEGSEFEVLRVFPFDKYMFKCMTIEHNYEEPKRTLIRDLLESRGYKLAHSVHVDDWYINPSWRNKMVCDTFMFYNEFDVLELRLECLDPYVDRFVLVESEVNHVGDPKPLYFRENKERFSKWLHKITHVIVTADETPKDEDPWVREKYQRECVLKGLDGLPNNAVVMVSDVDEIPDMAKISCENLPSVICSVHMWMFEYSLDYLFTGEPWFGTVITNCELFKRVGPNNLRDNRWKFFSFKNSGWHLSSLGNLNHIWQKFQTYAHAKDAHIAHWTPEILKDLIEKGIHTDGKTTLVRRPPNVPLPGSIQLLKRLKLL